MVSCLLRRIYFCHLNFGQILLFSLRYLHLQECWECCHSLVMEDSLLRELQGSSPSIVLLHEGCVLIKDLLGKDEPPRDVAERDLVVLCMQSLLIILQSGEINQTPIEFYKKFVISVEKKCPWSFNEVILWYNDMYYPFLKPCL